MTDKEIWNRFAIAQRELTELIKLDKARAKNIKYILRTPNRTTKEQQDGVKTCEKIRSKT